MKWIKINESTKVNEMDSYWTYDRPMRNDDGEEIKSRKLKLNKGKMKKIEKLISEYLPKLKDMELQVQGMRDEVEKITGKDATSDSFSNLMFNISDEIKHAIYVLKNGKLKQQG